MTTIWVVALEPISMRYTKDWYNDIPNILAKDISKRNLKWKVMTIPGEQVADKTTKGAFLDFGATNFYKGSQVANISHQFSEGRVKAGDKFLVTDFWHFGITAIRYMSELLDIPIEIHCIAHAGAYDPTDILGLKMSKEWPMHQEKAWFHASDYFYFGTEFHRQLFLTNLKIQKKFHKKAIRTGQPYREVAQRCTVNFDYDKRDDVIIFTHRLNEDKQPEIFEDLVQYLPDEWGYVITQKNNYSKEEYYAVLAQSKMVFSCALHENLGIGMMEGVLNGCVPIVPSRACYDEIYQDIFKYPSAWTKDWDSYIKNRNKLVKFIEKLMKNYQKIHDDALVKQSETIINDFMYPEKMIEKLLTPMKVKV